MVSEKIHITFRSLIFALLLLLLVMGAGISPCSANSKKLDVYTIDFNNIYYFQYQGGTYEKTVTGKTWYRYNYENWDYSVTLKNGDCIKHTSQDKKRGFVYKGEYYDVDFRPCHETQSYNHQWGPGKYDVVAEIGNCSTMYSIEILDVGIKSITFKEKTVVKNNEGEIITELNEKTGKKETYWYYYPYNTDFTITLSNGKRIKQTETAEAGFKYKGKDYAIDFFSSQSVANPWNVGKHKVNVSCGGYATTYTLNIIGHKNLLEESYQPHYISGNYAYIIRKREAQIIGYFGDKKVVKVPSKLDGFKVTAIRQGAFYQCMNLERLTLPEGLVSIDGESIAFNKALKYVYLPATFISSGGTYIGGIYENPKLEKIEISPKNPYLTSRNGTVYNKSMTALIFHPPASKVEKLVIPEGVVSIRADSCRDNPNLKTVVMPDSVIEIGYWAFIGSSNLEYINISKNCQFIGQYAFGGTKIKELHLPDCVSILGGSTFHDMPYLKKITIDNNHPNLYSVDGILYQDVGSGSTDKEICLVLYPASKKNKEYVVLPGTKYVCEYAFLGAKNLESLILPESVRTLEHRCFWDCLSLKNIIVFGKITGVDDHIFANDYALRNIYFLGDYSKKVGTVISKIPAPKNCTFYYKKGNKEFAEYVEKSKYKENWKTISTTKRKNLLKEYYPGDCNSVGKKHAYRMSIEKKAIYSWREDGKLVQTCSKCGKKTTTKKTIYRPKTIKLSWKTKTYTGKNIAAPKVTIKDRKGNVLQEGRDYELYDISAKLPVGRYEGFVQFIGRYSSSAYVYYTIVPRAPKTVKAELCGYNDVKVSWSKSEGATGYTVYYKNAGAKKYTFLTRTTNRFTKKAENLEGGKKYKFKVVPYFKSGDKRYDALTSTTASVTTLKKVTVNKVSKTEGKVKVSWKNINGETGYQISRSTKKSGTNIVATVKSAEATYKTVKAAKGKTYYYKVRAYKTVKQNGKTKRIYGPWSKIKEYKR